MRLPILAFNLIVLGFLAGCGTKGPLILPPGPDNPPLFGRPAPKAAVAPPPAAIAVPKPETEASRNDSNKPAEPTAGP